MEKIIGLKELREHMDRYSSAVQKGDSFVVVRKSKPLFKMTPLEEKGQWEEVIDFTKLRKGGVRLPDLLSRL